MAMITNRLDIMKWVGIIYFTLNSFFVGAQSTDTWLHVTEFKQQKKMIKLQLQNDSNDTVFIQSLNSKLEGNKLILNHFELNFDTLQLDFSSIDSISFGHYKETTWYVDGVKSSYTFYVLPKEILTLFLPINKKERITINHIRVYLSNSVYYIYDI